MIWLNDKAVNRIVRFEWSSSIFTQRSTGISDFQFRSVLGDGKELYNIHKPSDSENNDGYGVDDGYGPSDGEKAILEALTEMLAAKLKNNNIKL
jgi:hypothetical protein